MAFDHAFSVVLFGEMVETSDIAGVLRHGGGMFDIREHPLIDRTSLPCSHQMLKL